MEFRVKGLGFRVEIWHVTNRRNDGEEAAKH